MASPKYAAWSRTLKSISSKPLTMCPRFPEIAANWEAWWNFKAERPLVIASSGLRNDIYWGKSFHLLDNPAEWLRSQKLQLENTRWLGDMVPRIRVDIGPEVPAAFLGAPLTISEAEQTSWNTPTISSWDPPPQFQFDPNNKWFRLVIDFCEMVARDARGNYVVCLPDMGGAVDVLSNMRDPSQLCMDLMDETRESAKNAAMQIADAWAPMFEGVLDAILGNGAGCINQMGPWSDEPYVVPTCDFNALIGPGDFLECCIPSLKRQAEHSGRICFHLDGPAAARHARELGRQDWIKTVQFTPGAGTPSALAKLDMFKQLQADGKPVLVVTPINEIAELTRKLDRRGLAILTDGVIPANEADEFEALLRKL